MVRLHWSAQINHLRRRKAVHRQAAGADAADELLVIVRPQFGVEAALEEHAAAAVVLEFLELGGQLVPAQDVAAFGPGRPVKGAEAAAGDADVGVIDVAVDDVGDPGLGVEPTAHPVGRGPQGQQVQVPEPVGCFPVEAAAGKSRGQGPGARGQY